MDYGTQAQNRRSRRSNVLMSAVIETADRPPLTVKLRNLSGEGALVEGAGTPPIGSAVLFRKGDLRRAGTVAWEAGNRCGIAFDEHLEMADVLRHIPAPKPARVADHRRPRLREELSPGERKIAEEWIFGRPLPNIGDE